MPNTIAIRSTANTLRTTECPRRNRTPPNSEVVESSHAYANAQLKGTARVLDICRREGADTYVNPPGGRELYDAAGVARLGIATDGSNGLSYQWLKDGIDLAGATNSSLAFAAATSCCAQG